MARTTIGIYIDADEALRLFGGLERNAANNDKQLNVLARAAHEWEVELLESEGLAGGRVWPADTAGTIARKVALERGDKTMHDTNALVDALLAVPRRTPTSVRIDAPGYALWAQVGTRHEYRRNIMGAPPQKRLEPVVEELIAQMMTVPGVHA